MEATPLPPPTRVLPGRASSRCAWLTAAALVLALRGTALLRDGRSSLLELARSSALAGPTLFGSAAGDRRCFVTPPPRVHWRRAIVAACSSLGAGGAEAALDPWVAAGWAAVIVGDCSAGAVAWAAATTNATVLSVAAAGGCGGSPTGAGMPSFAWKLGDGDVANVLTYIRNTWGNAAPAVSADDVGKIRSSIR